MSEILKLENISYTYGAGTPFQKTAVNGVNLTINSGDFVAIIGHTGSGKSTLVQHLNGLLNPTSGRVLINGEDINQNASTRRAARFACGLVFQYPEYQLFEETVFADIAFGPKNMGLDEIEVKRRVLGAAEAVGIDSLTLEKSPFDLSGGQKRRVAIAGVVSMEPEILVLDEPMAGLDPKGREEILGMIRDYHQKHGTTVILVTHSMEDAAKMASRIIVMSQASVLLDGTPQEIFTQADLLLQSGLDVPQITAVLIELKKRGYPVDTSIFTTEQALQEILRLGQSTKLTQAKELV